MAGNLSKLINQVSGYSLYRNLTHNPTLGQIFISFLQIWSLLESDQKTSEETQKSFWETAFMVLWD